MKKVLYPFSHFFLDNIRQSLGSHAQLGIKIASIRETTNLNNKTDVRVNYGMQSGNDIIELAYLDPVQSKMHEVYNMFKEMMVKRINYHAKRELQSGNWGETSIHQDEYDANYIIQMLFKDERNFNKLVSMSHGIPRNFINILNTCLRRLDYNLSANFIHCYLISDVVIDTYKNEHRSDLSFVEENTIYNAIDEYAKRKKQYFFLIDNKTAKRLRPEINTLLYNEIIHRIPSAETPANIMNSYKAYYLDLGMYFLTIRDANFEEYIKTINSFQLLLPEDLARNSGNYILDLNNVESSLVICPSCKAIFPKTQPVFTKYHICPECAVEISISR